MSDWISAVCSSDLRRGVPPRTPTEVRPLPELGPGRIALGVLGDVRGARAGCVEAVDRGPVGPADAPVDVGDQAAHRETRSEEHTSELQSLMRISYAVFCLKKKKTSKKQTHTSKP